MQTPKSRRPRGTGRIFQKHGNWYGQWHGLTRKLGPVREPGSRQGLTRAMAEARLRERMSETLKGPPNVTERTTVGGAARVRIKELARKGRKVGTTRANYEFEIRVHFEPHFGQMPIAQFDPDVVDAFLEVLRLPTPNAATGRNTSAEVRHARPPAGLSAPRSAVRSRRGRLEDRETTLV